MEMRLLTREEIALAYERDLKPAFPESELKPLWAIEQMLSEGEYRPWGLFDGEELVGEAFLWTHVPRFALFDYLCVRADRRNDGLGALLIEKLLEAERGNVVFGEAEIPQYAPDREMAERRLEFYRRCGVRQAGYDTSIFGVPYHTLYWFDIEVPDALLCAAHEQTYRSRFVPAAYDRFLRIPWDESMGLTEKVEWTEEDHRHEDIVL